MNTNHNEPKRIITKHHYEEEELLPRPVSPISHSLHSSTMAIIILTVFEFETPISESEILDFLRNDFVPTSPRFSWTIETDKKGVATWKKVEIHYEDRLVIPTFPSQGLQSKEEHDEQLREYLSEIGSERFPEGKPLWEAHLIKYPSLNGVRTLVLKWSHAIGDGYSFAGLLLNAFKRAGNPSLPLSAPQVSLRQFHNVHGQTPTGGSRKGKKFIGFISKCVYSASDVAWSMLKMMSMKDRPTAIRSEKVGLHKPINIYTMTFSLERFNQLKSKLGATMNDVIMGIISYMIHSYLLRMGDNSSNLTILVMINMRQLKGYNSIDEMINAADSWGNHSRLLPVPIPSFHTQEKVNPLDFIFKAKETMSKKKKSAFIHVMDPVANIWRGIKGQKGLDKLVHSSFENSSTLITSVICPKEQMAIGVHPVNSFYFLCTGIPQSLTFNSVSCNGELKLLATMEKGFIDYQIFSSCMNEAFENTFAAAAAAQLASTDYQNDKSSSLKTRKLILSSL